MEYAFFLTKESVRIFDLPTINLSPMGSTPFPRTVPLRVFSLLLKLQSPPFPGIMPAFDVVKDIRSGLQPWCGTVADSPRSRLSTPKKLSAAVPNPASLEMETTFTTWS